MSQPPQSTHIPFRLDGDVAIVTGAGSRLPGEIGNGRAISILLARQGAKVGLLDLKTEWAEETKSIIEREGGIAEAIECDVTVEESCKRAVDKVVGMWGGVRILVNNVGVGGPHGTVVDVDMDAWDRDMRINLTSMVLMSRHAIPHMRKAGEGTIINMSSVSGIRGGNPGVLYPTSKGAIIQLTRVMAKHHGKENIRVNCIAPGMVFTPMVRVRGMTEEMRKARMAQSLMGTEGTAWDVGYAALYLASHEARWITGICLPVDAGTTAGVPNRPDLEEDRLSQGFDYSQMEINTEPPAHHTS